MSASLSRGKQETNIVSLYVAETFNRISARLKISFIHSKSLENELFTFKNHLTAERKPARVFLDYIYLDGWMLTDYVLNHF